MIWEEEESPKEDRAVTGYVTTGNVFWEVLMKMMNSNIMTAYFEAVK